MADAAAAAEWKAKGNASLSAGNFAEAVEHYTKAIECDGSNHVFFSNRSAAYLSLGQAQKALEDADQCVKINPTWPKGYGRKGAALHKLGKAEESIAAYEAGLKVDPENAALKEALDAVQKDAGPFGSSMFPRLASNPKFAAYLADPAYTTMLRAIQANPQALSMYQQDPRLMETVGFLLGIPMQAGPGGPGAAGGADDAGAGAGAGGGGASASKESAKEPEPEPEVKEPETEEEKAKREVREKAQAIKAEGNALYKEKKYDEALAKYDEAIAVDGEDVTFILNKASVHFAKGDYDACIETCKSAIERGRELMTDYSVIAKAFHRMGNAHLKKDEFPEAVEAYESSLMEHHTEEVWRKVKKTKATMKKRLEEAYWDEGKAAEAKARGNELFKAGSFREALEEYTEAIKRDPKSAVYYANRATTRMKLMDFDGAMKDIEESLSRDPKYVKAITRKAGIQFFRKEYHKAMETYQVALELEPHNAEVKDGLVKTVAKINEATSSGEVDQERASRGMQDPEIQAILADPMVSETLRSMQTNPGEAMKAMNDPVMGAKLRKLIAAGVLQVK